MRSGTLMARAAYEGFEDLWAPLLTGVAPSGAFVKSLDAERRAALHDAFRRRLGVGEEPFELTARAWAARGLSAARRGQRVQLVAPVLLHRRHRAVEGLRDQAARAALQGARGQRRGPRACRARRSSSVNTVPPSTLASAGAGRELGPAALAQPAGDRRAQAASGPRAGAAPSHSQAQLT